MRLYHLLAASAVAFQLLLVVPVRSAAADPDTMELVRDGRPVATVLVPEKADQWTRTASGWLVDYLRRSTGARLSVVSEPASPEGIVISVGHTRRAVAFAIKLDGLRWDDCRLVVKRRTLFLIGRDDAGTKTHDWVGARGTCRAVIKFLEDTCGVRWFLPGPNGAVVPRHRSITVAVGLDVVGRTAMAYSDGRSVYDVNILNEPGRSLSAQANNFRKSVKVAPGGHTYYAAVSADRYFKDHPEYFAVLDGKRTGKGNHLCSTNPDVRRLLVEHTRRRFDQGLDWVSLGQEDGYTRCQCETCEKQDLYRFRDWHKKTGGRWETFQNTVLKQTPPERLFGLHKAVIDDVARTHPDKTMMLMCYAPTAWPSQEIPHFGKNVIGELMNVNPDYVEAWRDKVGGLTGYVYWFNTQCPMGINVHMTPREVALRLKYLHRSGFLALSVDPEAVWGLQGPVFYLVGRLMGDPTLDEKQVVAEYCRGVFGPASGPMEKFFALLHQRLEAVVPVDDADISADARNTKVPRDLDTQTMYLRQYTPEVLTKLEGWVKQAERLARTKQQRGWVRLSRDQFDFLKLVTGMARDHRAWKSEQAAGRWKTLKRSVAEFESYRHRVVNYPKEHTDSWFPGHATFCKWLVANLENTTTAYYVGWPQRRAEVLKKGLRGRAMGYGTSYYYSFIREPLTLDFSKPAP